MEKGPDPGVANEPADHNTTSKEETDDFIVDWDGDDDPENPLNWPSRKKGIIIALLSSLTFVTYAVCTVQPRD